MTFGGGKEAADDSRPPRKGRPRGSKNKRSAVSSSASNNGGYEKKSFAFESTASARCKACDQTFDGDPVAHCVQHHEAACPLCGGSYRPPLAAHIRSHGTRPSTLTVTCYECYECKEKYGDVETMATHVRDQHVGSSSVQQTDGAGKRGTDGADATTRAFECALCGVQSDGRHALVEHLVAAHCPRKTFQHPAVYRCRVCQAGFKSQINVLRHACNKIKTPHCARCDKTFPSKMRYSFHLQFHEHPKCAPMHLHCDICLAEFEDENQLYDHIRFRHELHDKAVCEICGRTFKSSMGLNIHRRYHNGSRNFTCESCDKSFLNKSTLKEHEISHMDVKPFQCHICGQYLSRASRLRSHVKTHRAAESTSQVCHCCGRCGFVAPNGVMLVEHLNKEHDGDPADGYRTAVECSAAQEEVEDVKEAEEEIKDVKEAEEKEQRRAGNWTYTMELSSVVKCEFCDSTYMDAVSLNRHRDAAHANRDDSEAFICVVCSSTFSTYSRLTTHKLTHGINMESTLVDSGPSTADDKNRFDVPQYFSCQYCAKRCLHYTYFCLHRRLKHPLGVQTHTCDRCFLDFKTSWRLSYHKKTVHGQPLADRPSEKYECAVCSRKFVKIGALNLHKTRMHININGNVCKYLCHVCGKFFSSECSLRNHSKMHDGGGGGCGVADKRKRRRACQKLAAETTAATEPTPAQKHACPYCDETTEDRAAFVEHVNRHVRCGPAVSCELCDQRFPDATHMTRHLGEHAAAGDVLLCVACSAPFLSSAALDVHLSACGAVVRHHVAVPDVRFVEPAERAPAEDGGPQRAALVIDCSLMFDGGGTCGRPATAAVAAAAAHSHALPAVDPAPDEPSLLDELLGIASGPQTRSPTAAGRPADDVTDGCSPRTF